MEEPLWDVRRRDVNQAYTRIKQSRLTEWASVGKLHPEDPIRRTGTTTWQPAHTVPELQSLFTTVPVPPVASPTTKTSSSTSSAAHADPARSVPASKQSNITSKLPAANKNAPEATPSQTGTRMVPVSQLDFTDATPVQFAKDTEEDPEIDLTPMIDVTFQLLIFFMVAATVQSTSSLTLPTAKSGIGLNEQQAVVVSVGEVADTPGFCLGEFQAQQAVATPAELLQQITTANLAPASDVVIKGDKDAKYKNILALMQQLRSHFTGKITVAVAKPR